MAQVFHRSTNTIARVSIYGGALIIAGLLWFGLEIQRSDYLTEVGTARDQPVPFSHQHHVSGVGLDCRYCHTGVESSPFAGLPPTQTCMNCHLRIWSDSPTLEPVRESFRTGKAIAWTRVHDLADFVYFDHSVHVAKGVACGTCHGPVEAMSLVYKQNTLQMGWCLECHRDPEPSLTPREWMTRPAGAAHAATGEEPAPEGAELMRAYNVHTRTDCSTCHR